MNFGVKIHAFKYKNILYYTKKLRLPFFLPIKFILNLCNIETIYSVDNLYFSSYSNYNFINPIISFEILEISNLVNNKEIKNDDIINFMNITQEIKNYNLMIPIDFILNNNLFKANTIRIKYFTNGQVVVKNINVINNIEYCSYFIINKKSFLNCDKRFYNIFD
jgi:hypothetical protein